MAFSKSVTKFLLFVWQRFVFECHIWFIFNVTGRFLLHIQHWSTKLKFK